MTISRIKLIGGVDLTTPVGVIDELCKFYHIDVDARSLNNLIYRSKVITTLLIQDSKISKPSPPYNLNDMRNIATYLNYKDIEWRAEDILASYQFLNAADKHLGRQDINKIKGLISNRTYGEIKPKSVTLDYLTIYSMSKRLNIRLEDVKYDPRTTLNLVRRYVSSNKEDMEIKIISNIHSFGLSSLYRLISSSGRDPRGSKYYIPNVSSITEFHSQIVKEEVPGVPKNGDEAVVMAVLHYNLDISGTDDPLITYHQIVKNPRYRVYFPSITRKYNPSLPRCLYGNTLLKKLAIDEGYSRKRINNEDPLILCKQSILLNNFVHGRVKRYSNKVTSIYRTPIEELEYHKCVSYGRAAGAGSGDTWIVYTYRELFDTFEYNREFNIPDKKSDDIFTNQNIRKLLLLTSVNKYIGENNPSDRKDLNRKVKQIISSRKKLSIETQALVEYCKDSGNLSKISQAFSILTKATMYMRGWDGNEVYPLIKAVHPNDREQEVFYQVITNLSLYEKYIRSNGVELLMNTLPLVQYNEGNFLRNRDVDKGLTIGNRIDIIKDKNSDDNQYSCIRTTSNWFLASIYRYRTILKLDHDFDIDKARKTH